MARMPTPIEHRVSRAGHGGQRTRLPLLTVLLIATSIGCGRSGSDGVQGKRLPRSPDMQGGAATVTTTGDPARHVAKPPTPDRSVYETEADPPLRWSVALVDPEGTTPRWLL